MGKQYADKTAIIGVSKTQKTFLKIINIFSNLGLKPFDNIKSAKEWLTS